MAEIQGADGGAFKAAKAMFAAKDGAWVEVPLTGGGGGTPTSGWARPADWLPLTVNDGEAKVQILMAVFESEHNWMGIQAFTGMTIDWGDGVTEPSITGAMYHNYLWSTAPADTLTSEGFRQRIITITGNIQTLNLDLAYPPALTGMSAVHHVNGALEIKVGKMTAQAKVSTSAYNAPAGRIDCAFFLRSVVFVDTTTNYYIVAAGAKGLVSITAPAGRVVTVESRSFQNCYSLVYLPDTVSLINNLSGQFVFSGCYSIEKMPTIICPTGTDLASMFANCSSLVTMTPLQLAGPIAGTLSGTFTGCSTTVIPPLDMSAVTGTASLSSLMTVRRILIYGSKKSVNVQNMMLGATALNEFFTNLGVADNSGGQQTITITNCPGAATCDRSIATAKNWTVTG